MPTTPSARLSISPLQMASGTRGIGVLSPNPASSANVNRTTTIQPIVTPRLSLAPAHRQTAAVMAAMMVASATLAQTRQTCA